MNITKFYTLFAKSTRHTISKHRFTVYIRFDSAATAYMQMIFSGCHFDITSICCQFFICGHISMFYFKSRCIIKINDTAINDTFHFNDSTIVKRCYMQFDSHAMHIISADKTDSFNKSFSSF